MSVSPTDKNGPTQGHRKTQERRKTLTRVGIEPTTFAFENGHFTSHSIIHFVLNVSATQPAFVINVTLPVLLISGFIGMWSEMIITGRECLLLSRH